MKIKIRKEATSIASSILICIMLTAIDSCQSQPCSSLPRKFESYEAASKLINAARFNIDESVDTRKSSWIRGAKFKSCDGKVGFLVVNLSGKNYIHQDVPLSIWNQFNSANSFGQFYNQKIKDRYRLLVK